MSPNSVKSGGFAGNKNKTGLRPYLSPLNAWALSFGCAVGWGSFVMPGSTFLPIAGPVGSLLGIAIGSVIILIIGFNYSYMIRKYPDAGGTFTYAKNILGYDHGFLSAWFLILVYIAIAWANATALPLVFRNLLGGVFQVGPRYTIVGYDVYLGEALLALFVLEAVGIFCIKGGRFAGILQSVMALCLFGGVIVAAFAAFGGHNWTVASFTPRFSPNNSPVVGVIRIIALAPWCFVGFESICHSSEEFKFSKKKVPIVIIISVITGGLAYMILTGLAFAVPPEGCESWTDYIFHLDDLSGLQGLPTLYAIRELMGRTGLMILCAALISGVGTGLLGNMIAASRLLYAMAKDDVLPDWFGKLNANGSPMNALKFLMILSIPIPFFGRTAVGWIIDVNTVCATIAYAYTSLAALQTARRENNAAMKITGMAGVIISLLFCVYFLVPNFWSAGALSAESYLILIFWSLAGFFLFRYLLSRDNQRRFGQSTVVWIVMLFLIFFTSNLWIREATQDVTQTVLHNLNDYNTQELQEHDVTLTTVEMDDTEFYLQNQLESVNRSLMQNSSLQMILVMITLFVMFSIYDMMKKREQEMEVQKVEAEQSSRAKSTFLSNMSHDIRTPMNAIIGYTTLSKKEKDIPPKVAEYLTKIEASSGHLLSLINDVLEMSRIESGKMELEPVKSDLVKTLGEVRDLFITQMETKGINYIVNTDEVQNKIVMCDAARLNRVLLNLISNAYKFTPSGGSVSVNLKQVGVRDNMACDIINGAAENADTGDKINNADNNINNISDADGQKFGCYELRVKDTGMGMSPEFAAKVFEAYERERTASNIQGTGLGMAITKSIVDLMGGDISVETEKGKGTEFIIHVDFPIVQDDDAAEKSENNGDDAAEIDFSDFKLLLVEDNEINREIAVILLEEVGFALDTAENGQIAVDKIKASKPGDYQAVLMDIQMPVMNGYDAARAIRKLKNPDLANIPIIAMTANAFSEDVQAAKDAGMNSHIAKPIDVPKMIETLSEILRGK